MKKIFDIAKDNEQSWGTLATAIDGNYEEIEGAIYEPGKMDETIDLVTPGNYKKSYFGKVYASGTILKSMQTQNVKLFYLVNADDTVDTANGLINASKLPYAIPNDIKGIASLVSGDISLTFEVNDVKLNRIDLLEKKCSDELRQIKTLYGKKIAVFGDSIMHAKSISEGKTIPQYISEITGAQVINFSVGGAMLRQRATPLEHPTTDAEAMNCTDVITMVRAFVSGDKKYQKGAKEAAESNPSVFNTFISQMDSIDRFLNNDIADFDAIVIAGGTNDYSKNYTVMKNGEGQIVPTIPNLQTSYDALREIINLISLYGDNQHDVKLFICTPIVRWVDPVPFNSIFDYEIGDQVMMSEQRYEFTSTHPSGQEWSGDDVKEISAQEMRNEGSWGDNVVNKTALMSLKEHCKNIADVAFEFHIPVCDMYNTLGWNKNNFNHKLLDNDGTHPYYGLKEMAAKMAAFLVANKNFY